MPISNGYILYSSIYITFMKLHFRDGEQIGGCQELGMERRINGATKKWYTEKHCGDGTVLNIVVVVTVICLVKVKVLVAQSCLTLL